MGKYQNPADYVIKLAQAPELCNIDLNFEYLIEYYKTNIATNVELRMQKDVGKFENIFTDLEAFGSNRKVSCCTQFLALFKRNCQYLLRNPRSLNAILFNGTFTALLVLALFWKVGAYST